MGFSTDLQGKVSHDALLRLLDDELKLLETMKKCLQIRIDGDQKYVESLSTFLQASQKMGTGEFQTSLCHTWHVIMNETEKLIKRLQANVEDLHSRTLRNLCNLINSKKASKKFYIDERNHLEVDLQKLQDETQRQKQEYARYLEKYKTDKAKFDDATTKAGKGNKKYEDAKLQYVKTTSKLHRLHNNYLLSIQLMSSQQGNYLSTLVPSLLTCHEERQITMVESCKALLLEYAELTNPASTENQNMAETLRNTITAVKPDQYFVNFIEDNKTDQLTKVIVQFDSSLMDEYQGTLVANQLATDNTTEEMLKQKLEELKKVVKAYMTSQDIASDELEQTNKEVESLTQRVAMGNEEVTIEELLEKRQMQSLCKNKLLTAQVNAEKYESLKNTVEKSLKECEGDYPNALPNLDLDSASIASLASGSSSSSNLLTDLKKKFSSPFHSVFHSSTDKEKKEKVSPSYEETDATNGTDGSTASNSVDHVEPARQLEDEEWFHGVLPRDEVQRLLVSDGDYLVRESKNKKTNETQYVLSAFWKGHKHFIIQGGDGNWRFEGPFFPSIQQLISYQHKSGLAVTSKSQAILHKAIHREDWELKNDDILLDTKIGNGNFGEVYKGQYKPRNLVVAVKTCRDTLSEEQRKKFLQEGRILKQYNHPNIVTFIGIAAQRQPVMIVMEYVAGGSLLNFLRKQGRQQTKKQLIQMCENAANGMSYLESKNCIHRDLAARNCLVGKNNFIKISDFGMSREEEEYIVSDGMKQIPIKWTAPEALNYGKYTSLCDVWSFGILMWEVFSSGTTPYQGMSNAQAKERIDEGYQMPPPPGTLNNVYQLMLRCWSYKAENRPHFDEIHSVLVDLLEKY